MKSFLKMLLGARRVDSAEARRLVVEGAVLLDVRSPSEYAEGHIEGAVNVPLLELGDRLAELGTPGRVVVAYCRSGVRSAWAVQRLERAGFAARDLGAMANW
jgi:phage shock protein E